MVHFPHNDTLIVAMCISSCRVSRILIDIGSSINIMYRSALDRMKDTLEIACAMICPQFQSSLYEFDENETRSFGMISLPISADPYNFIMEFYVIDVESLHNTILGRP